jgi:hypothetical protein
VSVSAQALLQMAVVERTDTSKAHERGYR